MNEFNNEYDGIDNENGADFTPPPPKSILQEWLSPKNKGESGGKSAPRKSRKGFVLICLCIMAVGAIFMGVGTAAGAFKDTEILGDDVTLNQEQDFTSLELDMDYAPRLTINKGDEFKIVGKNIDINKLTADYGGGRLKVDYKRAYDDWRLFGGNVNLNLGPYTLTKDGFFKEKTRVSFDVTVPEDVTGLTLNLAYGDIEVYGAENLTYLDIKSNCGDVEVVDVSAKSAKIDSDFGDIKVKDSNFSRLDVKNDCGDTKLNHNKADEVKLESSFGDLSYDGEIHGKGFFSSDCGDTKITLAGFEDDYSICISQDVGDVKIDNQKRGNSYTSRNGGIPIEVESSFGDVKIEFTHIALEKTGAIAETSSLSENGNIIKLSGVTETAPLKSSEFSNINSLVNQVSHNVTAQKAQKSHETLKTKIDANFAQRLAFQWKRMSSKF